MGMKSVKPWPEGREKPKKGWKAFHERSNSKRIFARHGDEHYVRGKWYTAENKPHYYRMPLEYEPGFHVFFTEEDAIKLYFFPGSLLLEVDVDDVRLLGESGEGIPVFTCGRMRIPVEESA